MTEECKTESETVSFAIAVFAVKLGLIFKEMYIHS